MADYYVDIYEPISAVVTADTTLYSADNTIWPTADGGELTGATDSSDALVNNNFIYADLSEPVGTIVTADTSLYTADNTTWPTADGGELTGALDFTDAEVIPATAVAEPGGGGFLPRQRPYPIWGYGDGVLPELEGEAYGIVAAQGHSKGNLGIAATAIGVCGTVATADAVYKVAGECCGAIGVRGAADGLINEFKISAIGRLEDDDAAVIAFLLAA